MNNHESTNEGQPTGGPARLGVTAAIAGGALFALAVVLVALLGERAEDNALAVALLVVMAAGLLSSLAAFIVGVIARVRGASTESSWIPLVVFPAIIAFVILGEAFWWE